MYDLKSADSTARFMREAKPAFGPASKTPRERLFRDRRTKTPPSVFGTIVQTLYPTKPALVLSQAIGCSERAAHFYINGQRKPSVACAQWLLSEAFPK